MSDTLTATFNHLDEAKVALNKIDLRSLPRTGTARDAVKAARAAVAQATTDVRAAQAAALVDA